MTLPLTLRRALLHLDLDEVPSCVSWLCGTATPTSASLTVDGHASDAVPPLACFDDVVAAQSGDLRAASRLVERYCTRIASYAYAIVLNHADLDDVSQLIFLKMCARLSTLRNPALFEPWLYQLARRVSLDFLRREKFKRLWHSVETLVNHPFEDPQPPEVRGVGIEEVHHVLARLNRHDRQILVLASEGHSYEEIATLLGASRGAIKGRLGRVREFVRAALQEPT